MKLQQLMTYSNLENEKLLFDMAWLIEHYQDDYYNKEDMASLFYECIRKLLEEALKYGFEGNLWQCSITNLLLNDVNAYSKSCEIRGEILGSLNEAALHDIEIIKALFDYNFTHLLDELDISDGGFVFHYENKNQESEFYHKSISRVICDLAKDFRKDGTAKEMKKRLTAFYKMYGVGDFGLHQGFRMKITEEGANIVPIPKLSQVSLDDLVGYELQKQKLIDNTEAFVQGKAANNCLLYGDAGTGKSSSMKGLINKYYKDGLRIIEVYKHQFQYLNDIIGEIKNRNYKFIIYMDDLSFEDFELEYKYLKAVIEGGLEKKPDNILIYATSNRRHLVREKFSDKEERVDDLHKGDTVQEKLSLVNRFGVTIYFGSPELKEFEKIVTVLAEKNNIEMERSELIQSARQWEIRNGGLSGRTAQQFIDYLKGKREQ